jgi:hypothetical protein
MLAVLVEYAPALRRTAYGQRQNAMLMITALAGFPGCGSCAPRKRKRCTAFAMHKVVQLLIISNNSSSMLHAG